MKPGRGFLSVFASLTDRILCVVGAVLFSQGPEFMQQYLQRLGGHLAEARRQLAAFQNTADQAGLTLDRFIRQTAGNADPAVAKLGGVMTDAVDRVTALQTAHDALLHAALWERPLVFLRHFDPGIARATGAVYQPAVPTTAEGLVYALAGMLLMLAFYHLALKRLFGLLLAKPRVPAKAPA
ncbi:MAG: DUF2937 family protein [Verrucomicrobiota bacterium]